MGTACPPILTVLKVIALVNIAQGVLAITTVCLLTQEEWDM